MYKNSAVLLCWLAFVGSLSAQPMPRQPVNVLVIIADDLSPSLGAYRDKVIGTPGIDSLAKDGVLFNNAYCTASSCSPSRASILTGKFPHELAEGGNLWGTLPAAYPNYTRILNENGYRIGLQGKGWGPGDYKAGGYPENPAGPKYKNFLEFLNNTPSGQPFCFWIGASDPHRPYVAALKNATSINKSAIKIPNWLPDKDLVRADFEDYYAEVKRFDEMVQQAISLLKSKGLYDRTLIIVTSDNGMPFPRAKANAYNAGTNIPLIMRYGKKFVNGKILSQLVSLVDLAPTILDLTDSEIPVSMTGKSLLPLLTQMKDDIRFHTVFTERERHAKVRKNNLSYPIRTIRDKQFLLIKNLMPDRWPAGDPGSQEVTGAFGDIDNGPSKTDLIANAADPAYAKFVKWNVAKRPVIELYDMANDPDQLDNLAQNPVYAKTVQKLNRQLEQWRRNTADPLLKKKGDIFDTYPYYGGKKATN